MNFTTFRFSYSKFGYSGTMFSYQNSENTSIKKEKKEKKLKKTKKKICIIFPKNMTDDIKDTLYCPIGQEIMFIPTTTNCGHVFDISNINKWLEKHKECPICRQNINDTKNLPENHEITENLKKLKIKYNRKNYNYEEFVEKIYNFCDEFEIKN
jgi:hypothetical protein